LLDDVFGFLVVANDASRNPIEVAVVAPDERAESVSATLASTFEQFDVGGPVHSSAAAAQSRPKDSVRARLRKLVNSTCGRSQKKASGTGTFPAPNRKTLAKG